MVGEHVVQEFTVDDEDIVQVMEVVKVLGYQVAQLPPIPVSAKEGKLGSCGEV